MTAAIVILFVTQLLLPVLLIAGLWRGKVAGEHPSAVSWLAGVLGSGAFVSYFLLVGRWDWVSYYLRVALLVAFLLARSTCLSVGPLEATKRSPGGVSPGRGGNGLRWYPTLPSRSSSGR